MFILYKKRDFNAHFSDTIAFFKTFGKHYFKNYFIINGFFLILLVVMIYFITKVYMETVFTNLGSTNPNPNFLENYFESHTFLIIGVLVFLILFTLLFSLFNSTYPIIYLKLLEKNKNNNFTTNDIVSGLKENIVRLLQFFLGTILLFFPIAILVFGLLLLLCFIIIGIPLLMIVGPAFMSWIALSYFEFVIRKVGFFKAITTGFILVKQQFWTTIGTTFLMMTLVQIIQGFFTMIPYVIGLVWIFVSSSSLEGKSESTETLSIMTVLLAVILVISILLSYFLNNILFISQGLIYYSLADENENTTSSNLIEQIGTECE